MTRRGLARLPLQSDTKASGSVLFLFLKNRPSRKGADLVEIHKKTETGLDGGNLGGKVLAIEGKTGLQPEAIPRSQSAREESVGFSRLQNSIPDHWTGGKIGKNFKPVFAGITGSGDQHFMAGQPVFCDAVPGWRNWIGVIRLQHPGEDLGRFGSLKSHSGGVAGSALEENILASRVCEDL